MSNIQRAISIRQPYAELILRGEKVEEYRSRPTRLQERVYLYAGLQPGDHDAWEDIGKRPGDLPTGVMVGTVDITGCEWDDDFECYAWQLSNPRRLRERLRPKNQPQPGIWRPQF